MNAPTDCALCPRLCTSRRAVVNGTGPADAAVIVIGQAPGKTEERARPPAPLIGWSGQRLDFLASEHGGLDPLNLRKDNIAKCRPPLGRTGDLPPTPAEVQACSAYLLASLAEPALRFIITLGDLPLRWFDPTKRIGTHHGRAFDWTHPDTNDSIMVIPMYHPAAAAGNRNPALAAVMIADWQRLPEIMAGRKSGSLGTYTQTDVEGLDEFLRGKSRIAFDFETTDPNWRRTFQAVRARPIGVSVAGESGAAVYLHGTDMSVLAGPLGDMAVEVWAHNAIFEYIVARSQGIRITNLHDDKLLAYVLRRPSTGLKDLSWSELGIEQTRFEEVDWEDLDEVVQYGGADSDLCARLRDLLLPIVERLGLSDLYEQERRLIPVLGEMEIRGIRLDPTPLVELGEELAREAADLESGLRERFRISELPEEDQANFSLSSNQQLGELLYGRTTFRPRCARTLGGRLQHSPECNTRSRLSCVDFSCAGGVRTGAQTRLVWLTPGLGWPVTNTTPTGQPATDMDTIRSYVEYDAAIVNSLVKLASIAQCLNNNVKRLPELVQEDGRIHPSFHQAGQWEERKGEIKEGPMTSRTSSSGPNLQNITHHGDSERPYVATWAQFIRRGFIPTEGMILVAGDIGQEEPRIAAWGAGEDKLLWELDHGDVYRPVAARVFNKLDASIDLEERQIGKRCFMAWLNGAGPSGIQQSAFWLPDRDAQAVIDWLVQKYTKIEGFRANLVAHLHETGYTETYFKHRVYRPAVWTGPGAARNHAERSVMPDFIQGTAGGVMKTWLWKVDTALRSAELDAHLLLTIHDEIVLETWPDLLESVCQVLRQELNGIVPVSLPCELKTGPNWADMVKLT